MLRLSLGVMKINRISNNRFRRTAHVRFFGDKVRKAGLRWSGHVQWGTVKILV